MKYYKSVEFLSNFTMSSPLHKRKVSLLKIFWLRFCCCLQIFFFFILMQRSCFKQMMVNIITS